MLRKEGNGLTIMQKNIPLIHSRQKIGIILPLIKSGNLRYSPLTIFLYNLSLALLCLIIFYN
jgi:hypothetical protein